VDVLQEELGVRLEKNNSQMSNVVKERWVFCRSWVFDQRSISFECQML
jgi:hypothetical protein